MHTGRKFHWQAELGLETRYLLGAVGIPSDSLATIPTGHAQSFSQWGGVVSAYCPSILHLFAPSLKGCVVWAEMSQGVCLGWEFLWGGQS